MPGYNRTVLTYSAHHCCSLSAAHESPFSKYCKCTICAQNVLACLSGHLDMIHGAQILDIENTVIYWGAGVWTSTLSHSKKTTMLSFHCANDTLLLCARSCYQDSCTIFERFWSQHVLSTDLGIHTSPLEKSQSSTKSQWTTSVVMLTSQHCEGKLSLGAFAYNFLVKEAPFIRKETV